MGDESHTIKSAKAKVKKMKALGQEKVNKRNASNCAHFSKKNYEGA